MESYREDTAGAVADADSCFLSETLTSLPEGKIALGGEAPPPSAPAAAEGFAFLAFNLPPYLLISYGTGGKGCGN